MATKILVVEDSRTQAEALCALLADAGYTVVLAPNGEAGLVQLEADQFAVVISDIVMPGAVDGYELCRRIKAGNRPETPVVLLTSLSDPMDIIRGLECGADNFFTKGVEPAHLLNRLKLLLTTRETRAQATLRVGVTVFFMGREFTISSEREQILDLLISTFEDAVRQNGQLRQREDELAVAHERLSGLYRIALELNKVRTEAGVVESVLEHVLALPGVQAGWISLREGESGFRLAGARGLPPVLQAPGALQGDCLCRRKLLAGELDRVANVVECERLRKPGGEMGGLRYHASVPLWIGDRTVGVLNLAGVEEGLFSEDELGLLYGVGNQVAIALERARLHEHMERMVTERTGALQESEERYRNLVNEVNDGFFVTDEQGVFTFANPALATIHGVADPSQITGHHISDFLPASVADEAMATFRSSVESRTPPPLITLPIVRPDGSDAFVEVKPALIIRGDRVIGMRGVVRDITQRRRLEEQLRLAQKMEAVGTLAGGVAHDFNNMLAVIKSSVDLILPDLEADSAVREDLKGIDEAVNRATALTRQLLAFGRKQVLEPRAVDLNALISGTVKMLERILGADLRLVLRPTADPTTVRADPGPLEQVLMNLCTNARDAMPQGGELAILTERLTIDEGFCLTHPWARPGDYVRLTVSDTGMGMDAATQAKIFEPFFTTKELGRGTGLGLAVVYGIVKQHGGLIHVYSEPGTGTTFRIYLPFDPTAPEALAAQVTPELVGGTETILLAEDDDALRATATRLLEKLGYRVISVANGEDALEALAKGGEAVHLAVLDVVMPRIGGRQVFEQVHGRYPNLPFIFTTGYSPGTSHTEPIRTLPAMLLSKPYGIQILAQAVRRALDEGRQEQDRRR